VIYSRSEPFCDYLTVTCDPLSSFLTPNIGVEATLDGGLQAYLARISLPVSFEDKEKGVINYIAGKGLIRIERKKKFHLVSASGGAITFLRDNGHWRDYLNVVGSVPHNVSRIDVAVDVYCDAVPILRSLEKKYESGFFSFGRKSLPITTLYGTRDDGKVTGTWYVGHRSSARVTARVYDKTHEALVKRFEVIEATTRYELTFKRDYNCSLWDALMPKSLFYTHASPGLLDKPDGEDIPDWSSKGTAPWESTPVDTKLAFEVFERRVITSPDIANIAELALDIGGDCLPMAVRHFEEALAGLIKEREADRLIRYEKAKAAATAETEAVLKEAAATK
jgi:hypothetical protein